MCLRCPTIVLLLTTSALTTQGSAGIALNAVDHGHYLNDGAHVASSLNYAFGDGGADLFRSFFLFDLSALPGPVITAELHLLNPDNGFASVDPTETITLYDVTTDPAMLMSGQNGLATYNDLGSGVEFGSRVVSAADNGTNVVIPLNPAAIAGINNSLSGLWAVGGAITTLDSVGSEEIVFKFTGELPLSSTQLVVTTVPAPGAITLSGFGLLASRTRRRRI